MDTTNNNEAESNEFRHLTDLCVLLTTFLSPSLTHRLKAVDYSRLSSFVSATDRMDGSMELDEHVFLALCVCEKFE